MKIALAQMEVVANSPDKNLETMVRMIDQAKKNQVDLVAFPEMCIGGYLLGDKWYDDNFCEDLMEYNELIKEQSEGIAIAYGNIFLDDKINERVKDDDFHPNKDGRTRRYNAVYVVQNKKHVKRRTEIKNILPLGVQPKTLLPNYRFFDDERYFFSMQDIAKDFDVKLDDLIQPFMIEVDGENVPIGFELCEDLWYNDYRKNGQAINPTKILVDNGAKLIINSSASPWTYKKNKARDKKVQFLKHEMNNGFVPFLYVNCIGSQNNGKNIVTFDGGSTIYNKEGFPITIAKEAYKEELILNDNFNLEPIAQKEEPKIAQKYKAIIEGIKHMKNMLGIDKQPKYVIALSGGIDSAINAALLKIAVGSNNVLAVNMSTKYNSAKTQNTAKKIAENLGIVYTRIPISKLVKANENMLENLFIDDKAKLSELNKENIQAKIRGTSILSNLASKYGAVFTNNGNKLEVAIGYTTLYGDVNGAIAPIGDLTKSEVFEMAKYLNKDIFKKEVIPEILIPDKLFRFRKDQIEPSAELKKDQIDPMKFGYHCALIDAFTDYKKKTPEDVMQWYIDGKLEKNLGITTDLIERWDVDDPKEFLRDLGWFVKQINDSVFKRIQAPPIIITSKSAYGYDIRESILPYRITKSYERLKQKIENMKTYELR